MNISVVTQPKTEEPRSYPYMGVWDQKLLGKDSIYVVWFVGANTGYAISPNPSMIRDTWAERNYKKVVGLELTVE